MAIRSSIKVKTAIEAIKLDEVHRGIANNRTQVNVEDLAICLWKATELPLPPGMADTARMTYKNPSTCNWPQVLRGCLDQIRDDKQ